MNGGRATATEGTEGDASALQAPRAGTQPEAGSPQINPGAALVSGALMGGADAIPGVSGGTIALIIGIYERFIASIGTVLALPKHVRNPEGRRQVLAAFRLLVPLGIGVFGSYVLVTKALVGGTDDTDALMKAKSTAPLCYGFFFGLVLFSIKEPWRRLFERSVDRYVFAVIGFLASFTFAGLPYSQGDVETWMLVYGGAGAISVMLLPGVSGSLLLVMLGQYTAVVEALHDRDIPRFLVFLGGIGLGLALFVPLLRSLLKRAHDQTMAVLTGLMAGSLRALWPWKDNYDPKLGQLSNTAPADLVLWVVVAAIGGVAVVFLLARLERRLRGDI